MSNQKEPEYTLTIILKGKEGLTRVTYEGLRKEALLADSMTAGLLNAHELFMPDEDRKEQGDNKQKDTRDRPAR